MHDWENNPCSSKTMFTRQLSTCFQHVTIVEMWCYHRLPHIYQTIIHRQRMAIMESRVSNRPIQSFNQTRLPKIITIQITRKYMQKNRRLQGHLNRKDNERFRVTCFCRMALRGRFLSPFSFVVHSSISVVLFFRYIHQCNLPSLSSYSLQKICVVSSGFFISVFRPQQRKIQHVIITLTLITTLQNS